MNWMDLDDEIKSREEEEIGSESREKGDLLPCSSPLIVGSDSVVTLTHPTHSEGQPSGSRLRDSKATKMVQTGNNHSIHFTLKVKPLVTKFDDS